MEIETIIEGTRGCGEGAGRGISVLWVHSFCLGMMKKKILEKDSGDGCATLWMCLMPLDCTLTMVKICYVYSTTGISLKIH